MKTLSFIATCAVLFWCACALADGDAPNSEAFRQLTVSPAAEPSPALRYRLLPPLLDRRPGNAALLYSKVMMLFTGKPVEESQNRLYAWLEKPAADLPLEEIEKDLRTWSGVLKELDLAARREHCDWELAIRDHNFMSLLLPEVQNSRGLSRLLTMQARVQIARGDFKSALRTMQTGYALAQHVASGPTLISGLVGMALCQEMSTAVEDWIARPDSPNLYWALTTLPRPLINLQKAIETEGASLYLSYPFFEDIENKKLTTEEWNRALNQLLKDLDGLGGMNNPDSKLGSVALLAIKAYPAAKQRLTAAGHETNTIAAMPVAQVLLLDGIREYEQSRDRVFRWSYLPYDQAWRKLEEDQRRREPTDADSLSLASVMLPAMTGVFQAAARTDREIAALRNIEAIRMYGAANNGKLPEQLRQIDQVPLALDPATGQEFRYTLRRQTALLELPPYPGEQKTTGRSRFEISIRH